MDPAPAVLEVSHLFYSFNTDYWALQDITVTIHDKQFVGIIGPNGGGKSTFIKLLLGILSAQRGSIRIFGKPPHKSRREIGYFPQLKEIDSDFPITVEEAVMGARLGAHVVNFVSKSDRLIVQSVLQTLDIGDLAHRKLNELSGGQRNRVFLARALACQPKILILDEPMAGLDVTLQRLFLNTLKSLNQTMTILIVDHNLKMLEEYVDEFICLNRCVAHGINLHTIDQLPAHLESGECVEGHYGTL